MLRTLFQNVLCVPCTAGPKRISACHGLLSMAAMPKTSMKLCLASRPASLGLLEQPIQSDQHALRVAAAAEPDFAVIPQ